MSQHDFILDNAPGANFRADVNAVLQAIVSNNSGATAPATTYALMWWACTTPGARVLYQRNAANSAWIPVLDLETGLPKGTGTASAQTFLRGDGQWSSIAASAMPIEKLDWNSPCFVKTGGSTMAVKAGTRFRLSDSLVISYVAQTNVSMPSLTAGMDYSIWCKPDGTLQALADPYYSKAVAPVTGAVRVGGWHQGLTAYGTTPAGGGFSTSGFTQSGGSMIWTQSNVDDIAGINKYSIWDLAWNCAGEQRGMTLDPQYQQWMAIYFTSTNHILNGPSTYNTDIASGSVLPRIPLVYGGNGTTNYSKMSQYQCEEIAASFGLHLPDIDVFRSSAFGVTEAQSLGGSSVTVPATLRQAGYTSRIGMEQATGHQWIFARGSFASGGNGWYAGGERGQSYSYSDAPYIMLLGSSRVVGSISGSRASISSLVASVSAWDISLRCAGDHLKPVWARGSAA